MDLFWFLHKNNLVMGRAEFKRLLLMSKIKINSEPVIYSESQDFNYNIKTGDIIEVGKTKKICVD